MVSVDIITGRPLPDSRTFTFLGRNATDPRDVAVADDWCWGAEAEGEGHAVEAETKQRSRRRARQNIGDYELIWLLQQRLRAVSWPQWRLRCMLQPHCTATAWELSDLDHSHAATPQRATRASCAQLQLLRSDLAPPAVDLLEALGRCVCTRRACCFCLVYRTSAASVELRPRG